MTLTDTHTTTDALATQLSHKLDTITWADVPDSVRAVAKAHLLDALGLALASTRMDYGQAVHRAATRLGSSTESAALGFGTLLPVASTALVDGTLIHGLDFDDTHIGAIYHATAPALAAALAVGQAEHSSGEEFLLAYVLGVEVGCRLAAAGAGAFHQRGFHPTGIVGTFAAACVTAKLRGLSPQTLTSALGLCGSQAAGILELHESWLKRMHPGWAAHSGIIAATLAEAGFVGPPTVFEGAGGLYASHIGKRPTATDLSIDSLGDRWMTAEIALKPYPCCHFTHAFADAAFDVLNQLERDNIAPDEVVSITCPTSPGLIKLVTEPVDSKKAPTTIYDALFSVQFVVATALAGRPLDLETFYDKPLDDPSVLALAALVDCPADETSDFPAHFPGEVILRLNDGRIIRSRIDASHGTPEDPLSQIEVEAKFALTAGRVASEDQRAAIAELVASLESVSDVSALIDACTIVSK